MYSNILADTLEVIITMSAEFVHRIAIQIANISWYLTTKTAKPVSKLDNIHIDV